MLFNITHITQREPRLTVRLPPLGGLIVSIEDHEVIEAYINQQESLDNASASRQIEYDQQQYAAEHGREVAP